MDGSREPREHIGWSRHCLNLRLSTERARKLRALAESLGPDASPTEAVDRAIELASAARNKDAGDDSPAADLADLRSALGLMSERSRSDAQSNAIAIADVARGVRGLAELISAVATSGDTEDGFDEPRSLRAWLDSEASPEGVQTIKAHARWQSKARVGEQFVSLELLVRRTPGGASARAPSGVASLVKLDRIEAASPFARTDLISAFLVSCQRAQDGSWGIAAFQIKPDGSAGPLLGSIKA